MSIAQTTEETLRLTKEALAQPNAALAKNVTIATGLSAYDLQAPAKNLYPTITPLRNAIPRVQRLNPGDAARWRTISSVAGSGFDAMGWVPEGQRSASMSYAANPQTAPYVTLGEEDTVTFEAEAAAQGYEDVNTTATLRLLQKTMRKEETGLLGGNASLALGTPGTPVLTASGSGATLPAATYSVIVVALAFEGYRNSSLVAGVATTKTITGNDGNTYSLNGGASNKSANATQAVTLGQTLFATAPMVNGAVAYAWYVGAAGSETLQAITTINSLALSAQLASGQQPASAISADYSRNSTLAFDGLLTIGFNPVNSAYVQALSSGTAGTGSFLTASGRGSVVEIDAMLVQMWNAYRLSPTVLYVNAQEQKNITNKCLTSASGPLVRYNIAADSDRGGPYGVSASGVVRWYYNPFSVDGGFDIPIQVHPDLPPGTILAYCERLPVWYQSNEAPNVAEVLTRRDYYRVDWPVRTRRREFGVYAEEVLAVYAPFGIGILTNIGNG
ncbi:hypothetical protein [Methylocapsa sp. S129]|uniref:hypothetical protein n=1 Tax=Methylocapsa sp. S129 TaxID=1641869 RepID=UPI00131E9113|nr:hypothetical protein [Methylocapsa sp. S129]